LPGRHLSPPVTSLIASCVYCGVSQDEAQSAIAFDSIGHKLLQKMALNQSKGIAASNGNNRKS
jgi:hypothetical protein